MHREQERRRAQIDLPCVGGSPRDQRYGKERDDVVERHRVRGEVDRHVRPVDHDLSPGARGDVETVDVPQEEFRHEEVRELVRPEIHPLGFPKQEMEAEVGQRPEKKDQPLGRREAARHPRRKPPEKNGVCDQQRDTDGGIKEDSHAEFTVDDVTI